MRATPPAESHFNRLQNGSKANSMDAFDQQGLLEGLLQDLPARREVGEDLLVWLELREQNQLGSAEDALPSSEDMAEIVDGAVNSHQQAAEVKWPSCLFKIAFLLSSGSKDSKRWVQAVKPFCSI